MRTLLIRSAALILLAGSALADPTTALKDVPSGLYQLEKGHSTILFGYVHMGMSTYFVRVNDFDAQLTFDAGKPTDSKLLVTINPASLDSNNKAMDDKFKSAEFFDVAKFPKASFVSTGLEKLSDTQGKLRGNLTLHGVTKPVVLDVTFNGAQENPMTKHPMLGFSATGMLKRSNFGLGYGIPMVGDDVTLRIEAEFDHPMVEKK